MTAIRPNPDGSFTVTMHVTPDTLARMARSCYAGGKTHAETTAFLEKHCPTFRGYLFEVAGRLDGGEPIAVWVPKVRNYVVTFE
jgi:hypothetical protein